MKDLLLRTLRHKSTERAPGFPLQAFTSAT